jgi:hypothetical protein
MEPGGGQPDNGGGGWPWHLWLIIIAAAVYLGLRLVQGIQALVRWVGG